MRCRSSSRLAAHKDSMTQQISRHGHSGRRSSVCMAEPGLIMWALPELEGVPPEGLVVSSALAACCCLASASSCFWYVSCLACSNRFLNHMGSVT